MLSQITQKLTELLSLPGESEIVEFKEANHDYHSDKMGKYFSALANEANLHGHTSAWLIFGVKNDRTVVGTDYRPLRPSLDSL